jgi:magnesium chelatase family protein
MQNAIDHLVYSTRVFDKILKVARTIAELEEQENIPSYHISEAIQYCNLYIKYWS